MGETRNAYTIFVRKPFGKHSLRRQRNNGKMTPRWNSGRQDAKMGGTQR
jgi:hypothetical protein